MITWHPDDTNPCADRPDGIIGTATAILVAAAATAGSQAAAGAYGAHTQGSAAREGLDAQTAASNAALEYEKEQDRINREREKRLDTLKEQNDTYERQRKEGVSALEQNRYGDFTNNISPYLETGASANEQIAKLFRFPAPAPYVPRSTQGPGGGTPFVAPPSNPNIPGQAATPTPVSTTQPVDPHGAAGRPNVPVSPTDAGMAPGPERMVTLKAPDGTLKAVPESQVAHFESLGAVRV